MAVLRDYELWLFGFVHCRLEKMIDLFGEAGWVGDCLWWAYVQIERVRPKWTMAEVDQVMQAGCALYKQMLASEEAAK